MREIGRQETENANEEKPLHRIAAVALGWTFLLGGILGMFLPVVPGGVLIAAGAFLLHRRHAWARRATEKYRSRFPALDRVIAKMERREQRNVDGTQALCGTRKVLIFDQDTEELSLYAQPFEAQGVEVHKCASIESAMRCVEREQFDLALVDQVSPAFEGRRILGHLVRYNWPIPFIVLARWKDMHCLRLALELGAVEYLEKPVSAARMNGIIERFLVPSSCSEIGTPENEKNGQERSGKPQIIPKDKALDF
jgi:CheY-like chemotaxis protein